MASFAQEGAGHLGQEGGRASNSGYGSNESNSSKSPLNMSLDFLKGISGKKTKDGQQAKRRGPKPDSKPALTRRQELNRQAQRTHRERKEQYVKALEQEVMRLKEIFINLNREKDAIAEENLRLKEILRQHGISSTGAPTAPGNLRLASPTVQAPVGIASGSPSSMPGSYTGTTVSHGGPAFPLGFGGAPPSAPVLPSTFGDGTRAAAAAGGGPQPGIDYDQAGIDFVLTLERPCMEHMQPLLVHAQEALNSAHDDFFSGHALLASCPPASYIEEKPDVPFDYDKDLEFGQQELHNLLDLSHRIKLDGEITPVMAWASILGHSRLGELDTKDFVRLRDELKSKVRCYGFGAVLEEFEVRDALESVLAGKTDEAFAFDRY